MGGNGGRPLGICATVFAMLVSITLASVTLAKPAYALATPKAPTDWSYYVYPGDTGARAKLLGCEQARFDNARKRGSFVIMDFGAQRSNGRGTYLPSTTISWTNAADEDYALYFAYGYESCRPRHLLILSLGTSNDGSVTNGALGAAWGAVVQSTARQASGRGYSHVAVQGAIDAEPGFGPFAHFQGWELGDKSGGGYVSRTAALIDNFGSADGCPQKLGRFTNLRCGNGWNIADEYDAVWGWAPNEATPEIYFDGCHHLANQVNQWANVAAYGRHYGGRGMVKFVGPLSQGYCLNPARSWSEFQAALTGDGAPQAMSFSARILTK